MSTPQQPELARSQRSAVAPASAKTRRPSTKRTETDAPPRMPDDNQPGHRPEHDQDKPTGPPPSPPDAPPIPERFEFDFDVRLGSFLYGVTPKTASVEVKDGTLCIQFGRWSLSTTLDNIEQTQATGPYQWIKVAGPPRLSFGDLGITFATNMNRGVCIRFKQPVPALLPFGLIKHPAVTVTVADIEGLRAALKG